MTASKRRNVRSFDRAFFIAPGLYDIANLFLTHLYFYVKIVKQQVDRKEALPNETNLFRLCQDLQSL